MATNYTTNYDLCQWEPTDPVIRTDFNADNAKIEAALTALDEAKQTYSKAALDLAFYAGFLATARAISKQKYLPQHSLICDAFFSSDGAALTGSVSRQNDTLVISGSGKTGTYSTGQLTLRRSNWTQARMWLHSSGGSITAKLNGTPMEETSGSSSASVSGAFCIEREYAWTGTGNKYVQVELTLNSGSSSSMTVYDFFVYFY